MKNFQPNYLTYINESKKDSVVLYDYINESIPYFGWNRTDIYDINSNSIQSVLNRINVTNFNTELGNILYYCLQIRIYGNPEGVVGFGQNVDEKKATALRDFYWNQIKYAINSNYMKSNLTRLTNDIQSIKTIIENEKITISKSELYTKLVNRDYSQLPSKLSEKIGLILSNYSTISSSIENNVKNIFQDYFKSNVKSLPKELLSITDKGTKVADLKVVKHIPTIKGKWDTVNNEKVFTMSPFYDVFGKVYTDCVYYLFVNAIVDNKPQTKDNSPKPEPSSSSKINRTKVVPKEQKQRTKEEREEVLRRRGLI